MATGVTEVDELTSCPVCLEDFSEVVPHVPRILPCFHTLCEHCVEQLLQNNSLECPECREKHGAPRGVKTFQQNKYIIAHMRKNRKSQEIISSQDRAHCQNHGEEITMFCRESGCEKSICHLCLVKSHKFHNVVDLEEKRKENYQSLMEFIEDMCNMLTESKRLNQTYQESLQNEYEKSLKMIKLRKEELVKKTNEYMDNIEAKIRAHRTSQDTKIQNEKETIETNIKKILGIQNDMNEMTTLEDIEFKSKLAANIYGEVLDRSINFAGYTFLEFYHDDDQPRTNQQSADPLEQLCGKTRQKVLGGSKCCIL